MTGTTETYNGADADRLRVGKRPVDDRRPSRSSTARSPSPATSTSVKAAIDTNGDRAASPSDPEVKAALDAPRGRPARLRVRRDRRHRRCERRSVVDGAAAEAALTGAVAELVPDWAARPPPDRGRRRRHGRRHAARSTAHRVPTRTVPTASPPGPRHRRSPWPPAMTPARPSTRRSTCSEPTRSSRTRSRRSTRPSASSAASTASSAGWATPVSSSPAVPRRRAGGLVSIPTDPAAAASCSRSLRSFVALGGGQLGITVTDEDHGGTTVTTVDLGTLESLAGHGRPAQRRGRAAGRTRHHPGRPAMSPSPSPRPTRSWSSAPMRRS